MLFLFYPSRVTAQFSRFYQSVEKVQSVNWPLPSPTATWNGHSTGTPSPAVLGGEPVSQHTTEVFRLHQAFLFVSVLCIWVFLAPRKEDCSGAASARGKEDSSSTPREMSRRPVPKSCLPASNKVQPKGDWPCFLTRLKTGWFINIVDAKCQAELRPQKTDLELFQFSFYELTRFSF